MTTFRLVRFAMLAATACIGGSVAFAPAKAAEIKVGHFLPPVHLSHTKVLVPWSKEVAKRSNGSLTVKVFPARQLGGTPPGYYKMAVNGIADVTLMSPNYTPKIFPRTSVLELPVPPENSQHATRILYGLWDKYLAPEYAEVKVLGMWAIDAFIAVTKDKPIRKLEDIKGLKIRSPSRTQNRIIAALGGVPVNMPITQVYTAMDTGVVDGLTAGASVVFAFKVIDVGRYYTFGTPFSTTNVTLAMNKKAWDKLSAEHKKIVEDTTGIGLSMVGARAYDERHQAAIGFIKKKAGGREIIRLPEAEQKRFRDAAASVIEAWIAEMTAQGVPAREMWQARLAIK